ncbi:tRNA lysidine(34) synthetase TilS [Pseudomonadota bacterium]
MAFSPARLLSILRQLPTPRRYLVAYSGGLDSSVLLHALASLGDELGAELVAMHINHGLQANAAEWVASCEATCRALDVPLIGMELNLEVPKGESIEAVARHARYGAIQGQMVPGDVLLTAHHQDDQAETLLLQLMRGSGPSGLAAMPRSAPFGPGRHLRPLLDFSREQLHAYASEQGLSWVDDASNRDERFDRNFLRQQVMPLLAQRWPAMARTLSRSARHCAEAQALIDEQSQGDLDAIGDMESDSLPLAPLMRLPAPRCRALLRHWIRGKGFPVPDTSRLDRLMQEMFSAGPDRMPIVHWPGVEVRRYRDRLYLMVPLHEHDPSLVLEWDGNSMLKLPSGLGTLSIHTGMGGIDPKQWAVGPIHICFRQGGERFRPAGRGQSHSLKALFQEQGIPPWQRDRVPLITIGDQLAAVADLWVAESFASKGQAQGMRISWER